MKNQSKIIIIRGIGHIQEQILTKELSLEETVEKIYHDVLNK